MSRLVVIQDSGHGGRPRIEAHCEQIFQRASSINKDLINRMQNSPIAKTHIFGLEMKKIWTLATLLLLFTGSLIGTILFWFTNSYDAFILTHMVIANGTDGYRDWLRPKPTALIKVHIFNYTNVDAFEKGLETRLRVKELGPYVYEEILQRYNVHFESDGTVSFQNVYDHKFLPHLSKGKKDDVIIVPNIMVFSAAAKTEQLDYWARVAASMTIGAMKKKPFLKLPVHRFIWGYDDSIYELAKGLLQFEHGKMYNQVGLMAQRNGTSPNILTVYTGERSMKNFGMISKVNGFDSLGRWTTEKCDSVSASDGVFFPPTTIRSKQDVTVYIPEICRTMPFVFEKEVFIYNETVPAYRYILPENVFDEPKKEPSNQCYCDARSGVCPPQGFYNMSSCAFGAPLFMSLPHFKNVPPSYIKVEGINPNHETVLNYMDLHPTMGFPLAGMSRLQISVLAKSYQGFYSLDMFDEEGVMLPLAWIESGLDENHISHDYLEVIYLTTFTIKQLELAAKYITLLTTLITMTAIFLILKAHFQRHKQHPSPSNTRLNI